MIIRRRLALAKSTQQRNTFLTATSQVAGMGLGAVLALLVLILYGKNRQTDAFFAAYGVFAFLGAIAQGLRVSLPALLIASGPVGQATDKFLGAILLLSGIASIPMVFLGGSLAAFLVGDLGATAVSTATSALILLWLAGTLQMIAGLCAAILGAQGRFGWPAIAYIAGTTTAILILVALAGPFGILAVSVGVVGGGTLTCGLLVVQVARVGWRPALHKERSAPPDRSYPGRPATSRYRRTT